MADRRSRVNVILALAAAGSLACTLYAGRHNPSVLLDSLFVLWVFSPFAGLAWAGRMAQRSPRGMANAMRSSSLVIAIVSFAIYLAVAALPPGHHTTFTFLSVPAVSWLAILPLLIAPRLATRRR